MTMMSPGKDVRPGTARSKFQTGRSRPAVETTARPKTGRTLKRRLSAPSGTMSSLAMSLKKSAIGWSSPKRPVWVGPIRFWKRA